MLRAFECTCYVLALMLAVYVAITASSGAEHVVAAVLGTSVVILILVAAPVYLDGTLRRQWPALVLVALAVAGLAIVGLINALIVDTSRDSGLIERVCRPDGEFNRCQQAFQSRWSTLPLWFGPKARRIPSSVVGVAYYGALLVWFIAVGRPDREGRWWHLLPLGMTAAGTAMGAYLTHVMYARLQAPCLLCMASHVVVAVMLVVTGLSWPWRRRGEPKPGIAAAVGPAQPRWHRPAMALVLAGVTGILAVQTRATKGLESTAKQYALAYTQFAKDPAYMRWDLDRQPVVPWSIRPDDSVRGPDSAPFVVIVYSDFQCPQCRILSRRLEEVQRKFPGRIRLVFRHFPLDRSCNSLTDTYMHAFSCQAAQAAEAARYLGGEEAFWKMHDALFAHRAELDAYPYAKLAERIGLDPRKLLAEMHCPEAQARIPAHIEGSKRFKVASTPSVFLNGRRVRLWESMTFWQTVLEPAPSSSPATRSTSRPITRPTR